MSRYVEKMYARFKMMIKQTVDTPLPKELVGAMYLAPEADFRFQEEFEHREKVGCMLFYIICMLPKVLRTEETRSRTESYIVVHTWYSLPCLVSDNYITFVIPTIGGICFFLGQMLRSSG